MLKKKNFVKSLYFTLFFHLHYPMLNNSPFDKQKEREKRASMFMLVENGKFY